MHVEGPMPVCMQVQPGSTRHAASHPSPAIVSPSSQSSTRSRTSPSPHTGGSPRWIETIAICAATIGAEPPPTATTVPASRPSTRATNVWPANDSGTTTTTLSPSSISGRGGSGRNIGASTGIAPTRPEKRS
jgi:hypothetical protein